MERTHFALLLVACSPWIVSTCPRVNPAWKSGFADSASTKTAFLASPLFSHAFLRQTKEHPSSRCKGPSSLGRSSKRAAEYNILRLACSRQPGSPPYEGGYGYGKVRCNLKSVAFWKKAWRQPHTNQTLSHLSYVAATLKSIWLEFGSSSFVWARA